MDGLSLDRIEWMGWDGWLRMNGMGCNGMNGMSLSELRHGAEYTVVFKQSE